MKRLTYKSMLCGDYGSNVEYDSTYDEIEALRNALGPYEDLGMSADQIIEKLGMSARPKKKDA